MEGAPYFLTNGALQLLIKAFNFIFTRNSQALSLHTSTTNYNPHIMCDILSTIKKVNILTVHSNSDSSRRSIAIKIERSAAVVHLTYPFRNVGFVYHIIMANCCLQQTLLSSIQSVLCGWIGSSTADQVEAYIHHNSHATQTS